MSRQAMQMALEALELYQSKSSVQMFDDAVKALRQTLETEQEPVAWISDSPTKGNGKQLHWTKSEAWRWSSNITPLYTAPPKREWVGLTDDDVSYFQYQATFCDEFDAAFMAELIEKNLKEKNHG